MFRLIRILTIISALYLCTDYPGSAYCYPRTYGNQILHADTIPENQILYNGRIWRNKYFYIKGDPYLFSSSMLEGSVTINGKTFKNIKLLYDIYNDELLTLTNKNVIIQLNKEMVDEFTILSAETVYRFFRIGSEKQTPPDGFVNILYEGRVSLWIKYLKAIELRAVDNKYDSFYQLHKIYINQDGKSIQVRNKKQLLELFNDRKSEIRDYMREQKIRISGRQPDSFIPVVEFYNGLNKEN
jgi:hypothetical protein